MENKLLVVHYWKYIQNKIQWKSSHEHKEGTSFLFVFALEGELELSRLVFLRDRSL